MEVIKSISYDQREILNNIRMLYLNNERFDLDLTYSKGGFYKNNIVPQPKVKVDLNPQTEDTISLERFLQSEDNSEIQKYKSIVIDPPFIEHGWKGGLDKIGNRFGVYKSNTELRDSWSYLLNLAYNLLEDEGILIFKCQNVSGAGSKQFFNCPWCAMEAQRIGFYIQDEFILLAKSRLIVPGKQKASRKFHSFFYVFRKI